MVKLQRQALQWVFTQPYYRKASLPALYLYIKQLLNSILVEYEELLGQRFGLFAEPES